MTTKKRTAGLKLDGYVRVSDVAGREGDSYITEQVQEEKIRGWIDLHDHELGELFTDRNISGGKLDRPALNEAMGRIESGQSAGLVVYNVSRFSRSLENTVTLLKRIRDREALFASVQEQFDLSSWQGRMVFNILQSIAEGERERIGETWGIATDRAIKRGVKPSGTPYGYSRREEDSRLEIDPIRGPIVTGVFKRRAAGANWGEILDWVKSTGIPPRFSRSWARASIIAMVRNKDYTGTLHHDGKQYPNAHPTLVDPVTWEQAQRTTPRKAGPGSRQSRRLLAGLVRCAGCRYIASAVTSTTFPHGGYTCSRDASSKSCPKPAKIIAESHEWSNRKDGPVTHHAVGLEDYVVAEVFNHIDRIVLEAFDPAAEFEDLEHAVRVARGNLDAYAADTEALEVAGRDAWLAGLASRRQTLEAAERELEDALRKAPRLDRPVRELREDWENMTVAERRKRLADVVQCVFVRKATARSTRGVSADRVHIVWAHEPKVDVPRQGRRDFAMRSFVFPDRQDPDDVGVALPRPT